MSDEDDVLQLAPGRRGACGEDLRQGAAAAARAGALERGGELGRAREPERVRLPDRPPQRPRAQHGGEVDERPRGRR